MDAVLIGVVATAAFGLIAFIITKLGFGGEADYEQQLNLQKQALVEPASTKSKGSEKKKQKTEKKKKGKSDDIRESRTDTDGTSDELTHHHVEYDPDPVIVDDTVVARPKPKVKAVDVQEAKMDPSKVKSILHNRNETPMVRAKDAPVAETLYSPKTAPKDDVALLHVRRKSLDATNVVDKVQKKPGAVAPVALEAHVVPAKDKVQLAEPAKARVKVPVAVVAKEEVVLPTKVNDSQALPPRDRKKKDQAIKQQRPEEPSKPVVEEVVQARDVKVQASEPPTPKSQAPTTRPSNPVSNVPVPFQEEVVLPAKTIESFSAPLPKVEVVAKDIPVAKDMSVAKELTLAKEALQKKTRSKEWTVQKVLDAMQQATLSKNDLQTLVDYLLARQESGTDSWTTKGAKPDPLELLRRKLEETETALLAEQQNSSALQTKHRELGAKLASTERSNQSAMLQIAEFQKRIQTIHDQNKSEIKAIQQTNAQEGQRVQQQAMRIQQLSEENQRLKQTLSEADELTKMQPQLRTLQAEIQNLQRQLHSSEATLSASETRCKEFELQIKKSDELLRHTESSRQELSKQVDELGQRLSYMEVQQKEAHSHAAEVERNLKNREEMFRSLQQDSEAQIRALRDEQQKARESRPTENGDHEANGHDGQVEIKISSLETRISDSESQVVSLQKQLAAAKSAQVELDKITVHLKDTTERCNKAEDLLAGTRAEADALKEKNNELRRKNWLLSEALEKAESTAASCASQEADLEKKSVTIHDLKACNQRLQAQNHELTEKCEQLTHATAHADKVQQQLYDLQNVLDDKNKAIHQLELTLAEEKEHLNELQKENARLETAIEKSQKTAADVTPYRSLLSKLFPSVLVPSSLSPEQWLTEFEVQAMQEMETDRESAVSQYKIALKSAETMLDQLSGKAEQEHQSWMNEIDAKEKELARVRVELSQVHQELTRTKQTLPNIKELQHLLEEQKELTRSEALQVAELQSKLESIQCDSIPRVDSSASVGCTQSADSTSSADSTPSADCIPSADCGVTVNVVDTDAVQMAANGSSDTGTSV